MKHTIQSRPPINDKGEAQLACGNCGNSLFRVIKGADGDLIVSLACDEASNWTLTDSDDGIEQMTVPVPEQVYAVPTRRDKPVHAGRYPVERRPWSEVVQPESVGSHA